jgi:arsenite/tail-anchored protein-transporting ATPase
MVSTYLFYYRLRLFLGGLVALQTSYINIDIEENMRLILYLGKGGVGKTTTAAATAARAAELGHRTLVVSTDVAHSLADALDHPLGALPTQLSDKLWGQEINVLDEVRQHWGELRTYLAGLLRR